MNNIIDVFAGLFTFEPTEARLIPLPVAIIMFIIIVAAIVLAVAGLVAYLTT